MPMTLHSCHHFFLLQVDNLQRITPASASGLLHKTTEAPYPSDSPYNGSRDRIQYAKESAPSGPRSMDTVSWTAFTLPDTQVVNILMTLERAIDKLPDLPEATESDEISMFAQRVPTDLAKEDAWEYLDPIIPMLNRFLGFK